MIFNIYNVTVIPPNVVEKKKEEDILKQEAEETLKLKASLQASINGDGPTPLFARKKSIKDYTTITGQEDLTI